MEFRVIQGNIAEQSADVLVNAAGTSLQMGSGVAGALRRAANGPINEAAVSKGPVELGEVVVTDAYGLDAEIVIHAAAMPHYEDGRATPDSVATATRNSLETADARGYQSIVFPVLGTGAADLPFDRGARALCRTIAAYEPTSLTDVRIIGYTDAEYDRLVTVAAEFNE